MCFIFAVVSRIGILGTSRFDYEQKQAIRMNGEDKVSDHFFWCESCEDVCHGTHPINKDPVVINR